MPISFVSYEDLKSFSDALHLKLDALLQRLEQLTTKVDANQETQMASMQDLQAAVAAEQTVDQSVVVLLDGIAAQLAQLLATGATPEAIQAVIDSINANKETMAAAVIRDTPAAP